MGYSIIPLLFVLMMLVMRNNRQTDSDSKEEKEGKPMPVILKILVGCMAVFMVAMLLFLIDWAAFSGEYLHKIEYKRDCEFVIPAGYKLKYNPEKKKYAVAVLEYGDYYLWDGSNGIQGMFSSISSPCMFKDSCDAKAYLKAYINQNKPKF